MAENKGRKKEQETKTSTEEAVRKAMEKDE